MAPLMMFAAWADAGAAQPLNWIAHGPGPSTQGQVEGIAERQVVGALNAVAPHPTDAGTAYVGAVNGGIWKTTNVMNAAPDWTQLTDAQRSLSIGALEFDPTDPTSQTLVAGTGRFSSFYRRGGALIGLLRTTDGGATWTELDGGGAIANLNISGVAPRGSTIVLSANSAPTFADRGIWRSTDTGATFTRMSGAAGSGLAAGSSFDLASDPANPARLYTNAADGLYRSTDTGATWTRVGTPAMNALIGSANNVEISVGAVGSVFVAVVRSGQLAGVFHSADGGTTWSEMDIPMVPDGGLHPGGQGTIHLSIAADPNDPNIVYIGGDRQDFPNSVGATDYSGRLVRGDASQPPGSQFVHLTHSRNLGPAGGGTASSSAPHADSRDMDMAVNGVLLEVDDGGIYRRTDPQSDSGDWFSANGDIQSTEFHAVAWDANADIVIGGAQDTGTPEQILPSNAKWRSVSTADGGVTAVDDLSTPGLSVRYSSYQNLGGFRRRVYDSANALQSQVFLNPIVIGGGSPLQRQFYTPVVVNNVDPVRLIIGGANGVYESLDQADTIRQIGPGIAANGAGRDAIAYGSSVNPDMLYVGAGSSVFIRSGPHPAPLAASASYPGGTVVGIAIDPGDPQVATVIDGGRVFRTANAGASWMDITGNLDPQDTGSLWSVAINDSVEAPGIAVGTDKGVFHAGPPAFTTWAALGDGLPNAPVLHLEYDRTDGILLAGTLGRGAWTLPLTAGQQPPPPPTTVGLPWLRTLMD